jgi:hypothetical protein
MSAIDPLSFDALRTTPSHRRRGRASRGWVLLLDNRRPTRLILVKRANLSKLQAAQ